MDEIIESCYSKAKKLMADNRARLDLIAKQLREKETLEGEELDRLFNWAKEKPQKTGQEEDKTQEALF